MSKDTAQQEVEKVCFAYEKAGKTGNKKDWGKFYDLEDSLINKVEVANQTKLSIPKKIAEELDTILKEYPGWIYEGFHRLASRSLMMWCENNSGFNNCVAYLAGKALGVELVEVTDE